MPIPSTTFTSLRYSNSELLVFEGCAHAPIYEKVEEFNQRTLQFLRKHTGSAEPLAEHA